MKKIMLTALFAFGVIVGIEAAPTDTVTKADLQALIERINKLEAENKAQAKKIAELQGQKAAPATAAVKSGKVVKVDEGNEINESGKVVTAASGKKYYLADATANIFEPLSESGLQITPYGYLVFEGVYSTHSLDCDWSADKVANKNVGNNGDHTSTLSMQDSIMGIQFDTPEAINGWKFMGRAEFDLAGGNQNSYDFHWRHLYVNAMHETGWSILFGQTWHLWKMVTPSEIDGAWLENTGHPYRRSPQIRVTKKWDWTDSSFEWRGGIVKGGPGMGGDRDDDGNQDNSASAWPLFETAGIYDHVAPWEKESGNRWLLGVGGMYGRDKSHRIDANGDGLGDGDEYNSMMIMVAGAVPFGDFKLTGQVFAGENLGGVQAGVSQRVGYTDFDKKGDEIRTWGGFIDLAYQINDKWSVAIGYGFDDPNNKDVNSYCRDGGDAGFNGIKYNDRAYVDLFYQITSNFKLGFEYARMSTTYEDCDGTFAGKKVCDGAEGGTSYSDRFQFSAFYDF